MRQSSFRKRLSAGILAFLLAAAFTPAAMAQTPAGQKIKLPGYFQELLDNKEVKVNATAQRDDLGIERVCLPADVQRGVALITGLALQTAPKGGTLDVEAPFTLHFTNGNRTDTFAFSTNGVSYNGMRYLPQMPSALKTFYKEDNEKFYSATYFALDQELNFTAEQVVSVDLHRSHYSDDITMHLTARKSIAELLAEQKALVVRKPIVGERENPSVGGGTDEIVYTLTDGTVYRVSHGGGSVTLQKGTQPESSYKVLYNSASHERLNALLDNYQHVPQLTVTLNGEPSERIYQTAFDFAGESKVYQNKVPVEYGFDQHRYLPIQAGNAAGLRFSQEVFQVTARLYSNDNEQDTGKLCAVSADGMVSLPSEPGDYYLTVRGTFPDGTVDYFVGFIVSDLPVFFDSIDYGNAELGVSVMRDDLQREVINAQNRAYVTFIQSLDLVPGKIMDVWPASRVKESATLIFQCEGYPEQQFRFRKTDSRIIYNGNVYRARNDAALDSLYALAAPSWRKNETNYQHDKSRKGKGGDRAVSRSGNACRAQGRGVFRQLLGEHAADNLVIAVRADCPGEDPSNSQFGG